MKTSNHLLFAALLALAVSAKSNPIVIDASSRDYLSFTVDLTDGAYDDTKARWLLNGGQMFSASSADWTINQIVSSCGFGGMLCIRTADDAWAGWNFFPDWWFAPAGPELGYGPGSGVGSFSGVSAPTVTTSGLVSRFSWGTQPVVAAQTVPDITSSVVLLAMGVLGLCAIRRLH